MLVGLNELTIRALVDRSFEKFNSLPAIGFAGELPKTFREVHKDVHTLAARLLSTGIEKNDKITILGENSPNWVISYLAITYIGAVAVPILPGFPDADVRHVVRNSDSVAIFVSSKQRSRLEEFEKFAVHTVFSLEDFAIIYSRDASDEKKIQLLRKKAEKQEPAQVMSRSVKPAENDLASIIYTSGTTGHSKGVMLTHKNIVSDVLNSIELFPINSDDRFLSILPLSHTFESTGGMLCPLAVGAHIFYMQGLPTAQKLLSAMKTVRPTAVLAVPLVMDKIYRKRVLPKIQGSKILNTLYKSSFFRKKLNHKAGKKVKESLGGKLRFFMFGGAALNEDVEIFLREAEISYSTGYGMTETSPIMTINPFKHVKIGSCGKPIPGIEMKIHQPDSETSIGEIIVRGPITMQGYYKNPEANKQVFLEGGWIRTGDLGYFDKKGYLFIKGRSKNVIVGPSGENIYPEIIEQQILQSPYIQQVIVYQDNGKLTAKVYMDFDVLDEEFKVCNKQEAEAAKIKKEILEKVKAEANEKLPAFSKISRIIEYPEPFEMTPTNKVKRYLYIPQEE